MCSSDLHISRRTTGYVEIVRALRCGTFRAGGQPVRSASSPPLLLAGWPVEANRFGVAHKSVHHTTRGSRAPSLMGQASAGSAPALVPGGRKHPGPLPALTVRAAGRSGSWSQALQNGSTRSCGGGKANDTGCSAGLSRVGHYAFAHAGSGICRPVRFCPRAYGALAPGTVPLAGSEHQNSGPIECAETAGSVRGAVVHAVCPRSLTVAEVGRRRRFGMVAFGCGWKRSRPS